MLVMAMFAAHLPVAMPNQVVNVFIATFALCLVTTGWTTVRRQDGGAGIPERIALLVALVLCAPIAVLTLQLASGLPPLLKSAVPFRGPVLIAIYGFTTVLAIAAFADAEWFSPAVFPEIHRR